MSPVSIAMFVGCCLTPCHNSSPVLSISAAMHHTCQGQSTDSCDIVHVQRLWSSSVPLSLNSSLKNCGHQVCFGISYCVSQIPHLSSVDLLHKHSICGQFFQDTFICAHVFPTDS